MSIELSTLNRLYEEDYYLWIETTVQQLQKREINNLDWEHLTEEIEALGNELKHKVKSYLKQLLIHLLLYQYWQEQKTYCASGWEDEIDNFRDELEWLLQSKSLYNYFLTIFNEVYEKARKKAIQKTKLPNLTFPETCPFTVEQVLNPDFLPSED